MIGACGGALKAFADGGRKRKGDRSLTAHAAELGCMKTAWLTQHAARTEGSRSASPSCSHWLLDSVEADHSPLIGSMSHALHLMPLCTASVLCAALAEVLSHPTCGPIPLVASQQ